MSLPISTERLMLRRFTLHDVQDMLEFVCHPSVARVITGLETTEAGVRDYITQQISYQPFEQDKCFDLALERRSDGKVIGMLTLVRREHNKAEIGWALGIEHRGQGYVTEGARALLTYGFATLELHRIYATTSNVNSGSWMVMDRLGMRREACLREAEFRDGEWVDVLTYGLLAREWQARQDADAPLFKKVNLRERFAFFDEYWSPKIVGELNGQQVKLAKLKGEFVWHHHDLEDELFLVVKGRLVIQLRDGDVALEEGEFLIVPRGVEHRPVAEEEAHVLLFEPKGTLNTGSMQSERTVAEPEEI